MNNRDAHTRVERLREACEAALARLSVRGNDDPFAEIGEALFWLSALAEANEKRAPLLLGLAWARNRIAHGVIVAAPVTPPSTLPTGLGTALPIRLGAGSIPVPSIWLARDRIIVGRREQRRPDQEAAYDSHVAGRQVLAVLHEALVLAEVKA